MAQSIDTGTDDLRAEIDQGYAVITLNRPDRRNALSDEMLRALARFLDQCEANSAMKCIILTGAGGTFCAGGDVKDFADTGIAGVTDKRDTPLHEEIEDLRRLQRATAGRLYGMPKPTIAALEGASAGAGLSLALSCDLRVAAEDAFLITAFSKVGLSGDFGASWFLTHQLGRSRALELLLLSERVSASRGAELGLVNWTTAPGGALARAREIAARIAGGANVAYRAIKDNVNRAVATDLLTSMDLEVTEAMRCAATKDHADAVAAFAARRRA